MVQVWYDYSLKNHLLSTNGRLFLYLLALFQGRNWGTSLILGSGPFWPRDKVIVNIFEFKEITVISVACSLTETPLIWLLWLCLLPILLFYNSIKQAPFQQKKVKNSPTQAWFIFFRGEDLFICQIKLWKLPSGRLVVGCRVSIFYFLLDIA